MSHLIDVAMAFAKEAHSQQKRKYTEGSYFDEHLMPVMNMVSVHTQDPEILIAALLHDVIEDTSVTFSEVEEEFGNRVALLVGELTSVFTSGAYPYLNRQERKHLEAMRLAHISPDAKLIKRADIASNIASIVTHDPGFAVVYLREKATQLERILE